MTGQKYFPYEPGLKHFGGFGLMAVETPFFAGGKTDRFINRLIYLNELQINLHCLRGLLYKKANSLNPGDLKQFEFCFLSCYLIFSLNAHSHKNKF